MRFFYISIFFSVVAGTLLTPIKSRSLQKRDLLDLLEPVTNAEVSYGSDNGYTSHIWLHAHPERPLIIQERFDDLLTGISCSSDGQSLAFEFRQVEDANQAYRLWSVHERPIAIVDDIKSGCRTSEERGVYLLLGIRLDSPGHQVVVDTRLIPLRAAATKLSVSLEPPSQELRRRQDDKASKEEENKKDGFHGNSTISLRAGKAADRIELPIPATNVGEAQVHCVGCRTEGKVMIEARFDVDSKLEEVAKEVLDDITDVLTGKKDDKKADFGETLKVDQAYLAVEVVEDLKAIAVMEFFTKGKVEFELFQRSILPVPPVLPMFSVGGILTIGPKLDIKALLSLEVETPGVNFTYGSELTVPKGALVKIDYKSDKGKDSEATGWDKSEFKDIPFHLNSLDGEFTFSASIGAQPSLEIGIYLVGGELGGAGVGLTLDLPKVTVKGAYVHNVTSNCGALSTSDTTYHPSALNVTTEFMVGLNAIAQAEVNIDKNAPQAFQVFNQEWTKNIWNHTFEAAQTCWAFDTATLGEAKPAAAENAVPIPPVLEEQVDSEAIARGEEPAAPGAGSVNVPMKWWIAISILAALMTAFA